MKAVSRESAGRDPGGDQAAGGTLGETRPREGPAGRDRGEGPRGDQAAGGTRGNTRLQEGPRGDQAASAVVTCSC